jgi:hypothetical protein
MRAKAVQSRQTGEKGLKSSAIGFMEALIIGVASTAPAYSLATVLGLVVVMGLGFLLLGAILICSSGARWGTSASSAATRRPCLQTSHLAG